MWLHNLQNKLSIAQLERFETAKEPRLPMGTYFQVIYEANAETLEELIMRKKEGIILSEKLDAYFTERCSAPWIAKGEARGKAQGEEQKAIAVAKNLKGMGMSPPDIAKATGLSLSEVKRLG